MSYQFINRIDLKEMVVYEQMGWVNYNNSYAYLAGNKLISSSGIVPQTYYKATEEFKNYDLEIDDNLSTSEAIRYVIKMMKIDQGVSDILVANLLTSLLRSLFTEVGIVPRFTCYLVGESQTRKTTTACFISNIYNRTKNEDFALINLLSSSSAIHKRLSFLNDCCFIVDDLYKSESKVAKRILEDKLSEVIRTVGNNAAKETTSGKTLNRPSPNCNVICTAEYILTGNSTLSRCLIIHVDKPISSERLHECQINPKYLSTFVYYFIKWVCKNYNKVMEFINNSWMNFQQSRSSSNSLGGRLHETKFILSTSMSIFSMFIRDIEEAYELYSLELELEKEFSKNINLVINRQMEDMEKIRFSNDENRYSKLIALYYFNNQFELDKKKNLNTYSQGIEHKEKLCLSPDHILQICMNIFDDSSITINKINAELKKNGLLEIDASKKSTKKINKIGLLQIPIYKLRPFYEDAMMSNKQALPTLNKKVSVLAKV